MRRLLLSGVQSAGAALALRPAVQDAGRQGGPGPDHQKGYDCALPVRSRSVTATEDGSGRSPSAPLPLILTEPAAQHFRRDSMKTALFASVALLAVAAATPSFAQSIPEKTGVNQALS